jgi:threonylcarbamoyladenosine tRNA methylthiotransferase MtaB
MPQVPGPARKARAARLRAAGEASLAGFLQGRIGSTARVLVEKPGFGRSEHYAPVALTHGAPGQIVEARIAGVADGRLMGKVLR